MNREMWEQNRMQTEGMAMEKIMEMMTGKMALREKE